MSNIIIEEEQGTSSPSHHSRNGYYAFRGPIVRTLPFPPSRMVVVNSPAPLPTR